MHEREGSNTFYETVYDSVHLFLKQGTALATTTTSIAGWMDRQHIGIIVETDKLSLLACRIISLLLKDPKLIY